MSEHTCKGKNCTHTHTLRKPHTRTHTLLGSAWRVKGEVIQRCCFHKYPAAPAAGSGNPRGARRRSHTTCFLQEGRRASRKLLDTNNGNGKDSDSVTDRGEDSWVSAAHRWVWSGLQNLHNTTTRSWKTGSGPETSWETGAEVSKWEAPCEVCSGAAAWWRPQPSETWVRTSKPSRLCRGATCGSWPLKGLTR